MAAKVAEGTNTRKPAMMRTSAQVPPEVFRPLERTHQKTANRMSHTPTDAAMIQVFLFNRRLHSARGESC
jgi:hypothetical protein